MPYLLKNDRGNLKRKGEMSWNDGGNIQGCSECGAVNREGTKLDIGAGLTIEIGRERR